MNGKKVSAIIVAAGSSTRMGKLDKMFAEIDGVPVIVRTLTAFEKSDVIGEIIVSTKKDSVELIESLAVSNGITKLTHIVTGGETRQKSVLNALGVVDENADYIAIHDGARPLVSLETIQKAVETAFEFNACSVAVRVKDTIKVTDENGFVTATPDRSTLWAVQTPQVFSKKVYLDAVNTLGDKASDCTDDCMLVEATGVRVKLVEGSYSNIKITTPEDVLSANAFVQNNI